MICWYQPGFYSFTDYHYVAPKYDSPIFTDQEKFEYDKKMGEIVMQAQRELREIKERIARKIGLI